MFYIVSPKDLVLAKVCFERFTNVVSFHFGDDRHPSLPSSVTVGMTIPGVGGEGLPNKPILLDVMRTSTLLTS